MNFGCGVIDNYLVENDIKCKPISFQGYFPDISPHF